MLRLSLLICYLSLILNSHAASVRKISISKNPAFMLNKNNAEIVLPAGSTKVSAFAASELKKILGQSLCPSIPIVNKINKSKVSIIIGDNALSQKAGISLAGVPRDGYVIKPIGKQIYIVGKDDPKADPQRVLKSGYWALLHERGTLFGVYDFLERFDGVRFYFPGKLGTIVPEHKALAIPEINIIDCPGYTVRKTSYASGKWFELGKHKDGMREKNLNYYRTRQETRYIPNCHGLARMDYLNRFGKMHPEYFAEKGSAGRILTG